MRLLILSFNLAVNKFMILIWILGLFGLLYSSVLALSQIDIKKIVAYSSISHMNFVLLGLFSGSLIGISGAFFFMLGHAIVSSAFFFSVGVLYDRYKTRLLFYYGGLVLCMPLYTVLVFTCVLANLGFPGTVNFVGEFLILVSSFSINSFITFLASIILILTLVYSLFFFTKIAYGPIRFVFIRYYCDLTRREFYVIFPFFICMLLFGIFPNLLFYINFVSLISLIY